VLAENTYGVLKRLEFLAAVVDAVQPRLVVDIGCGTGAQVTLPLARRFPAVRFVGADRDACTLAFARQATLPNLSFVSMDDVEQVEPADLIVASEVVEHVADPAAFLSGLGNRLAPGGHLVVTIPNGCGPFELSSLVETLLVLSGAYRVIVSVKRTLFGRSSDPAVQPSTLAVSPHVNFFSFSGFTRVAGEAGLRVAKYRARTFLCGFGFEHVMRSPRLVAWNARVADRLPLALVSGWMFLLEQADRAPSRPYHRGWYARLRRRLNEVRFGVRSD
jgi:SAM-dependent methyltransferase